MTAVPAVSGKVHTAPPTHRAGDTPSHLGNWTDDFDDGSRVSSARGINVTGGEATLNMSRRGLALDDYGPFPTLALCREEGGSPPNTLDVLYPNASRTNYTDKQSVDCKGTRGLIFEDLNGDRHLDLVCANFEYNDAVVDSEILWGASDGTISSTGATHLGTERARAVASGDFNGDGWMDLAIACSYGYPSQTANSTVFLNQGNGTFNHTPDALLLPATEVTTGDLNNDGRDDLLLGYRNTVYLYYGNDGGLNETWDHYLQAAQFPVSDILIEDVNDDGFNDVLAAWWGNFQPVYLGPPTEKEWGIDFSFDLSGTWNVNGMLVRTGDLDGDGRLDIVYGSTGGEVDKLYVYEGTDKGWENATRIDVKVPAVLYSLEVADLQWDGYDDLIVGCNYDLYAVYMGASSYPYAISEFHTYDIHVEGIRRPYDSALAEWREGPDYVGTFTTEAISLPLNGSWTRLEVDASVPEGTEMTYTVLDAGLAPIHGLAGLTNDTIDLTALALPTTIHLRFDLASGDPTATPSVDRAALHWRILVPPVIADLVVDDGTLLRTEATNLTMEVTDEHDPPGDLVLELEHRLEGTPVWGSLWTTPPSYSEHAWRASFFTNEVTPTGVYDLRLRAMDTDGRVSAAVEFPRAVEVLNNIPTAPVVRIDPVEAYTTSTLVVMTVEEAADVESLDLRYSCLWYLDGALVEDLTGDTVPSSRTSKGQNWSVEVRAFDGEDEGPPAVAWVVILNSPPRASSALQDLKMAEDTVATDVWNLSTAFDDPDGDALQFRLAEPPDDANVEIDRTTWQVTVEPEEDWVGRFALTFIASDGELEASRSVNVTVLPVNDTPYFISVGGKAVDGTPLTFQVLQDQLLELEVVVGDVEDDALQLDTDSAEITFEPGTRKIVYQPGNADVGVHNVTLMLSEVGAPGAVVLLEISVEVIDVDDPMDEPVIVKPREGEVFAHNASVALEGMCNDPDLIHGQSLNFSWGSNLSDRLGWGTSLALEGLASGAHNITLTVTDGKHTKTASVNIVVTPPEEAGPGPDGDDIEERFPTSLAIMLVIIVLLAVVGMVLLSRRRQGGNG